MGGACWVTLEDLSPVLLNGSGSGAPASSWRLFHSPCGQAGIQPVFPRVQFHPITPGYNHVLQSPKQFFSFLAIRALHPGISTFPSHCHLSWLPPFINHSLHTQALVFPHPHPVGPHLPGPWMPTFRGNYLPHPLCTQPKRRNGLVRLQIPSQACSEFATCQQPESALLALQ